MWRERERMWVEVVVKVMGETLIRPTWGWLSCCSWHDSIRHMQGSYHLKRWLFILLTLSIFGMTSRTYKLGSMLWNASRRDSSNSFLLWIVFCSCKRFPVVLLPHLQEASANRLELHCCCGPQDSPGPWTLDSPWGCPSLWCQITEMRSPNYFNFYFSVRAGHA